MVSKADAAPLRYILTDISVRLLQATAAELADTDNPGVVIEFERYDLNHDRSGPLVAAGEFDVILAVNVLHNASDLTASLLRLCRLLKENGVLIISESICGEGQQVHQEFFLNLLPMPDHRKGCQSRFLSATEWRSALRTAGLKAEIATNSLGPELMLLATVDAR
jgi:SAM-dependent methyltransferase